MSDKVELYAIVHGKVQGVGFRSSVVKCARGCAVTGWVHNASDGTVELCAQGTHEQLEELLMLLQQSPGLSRVTSINVTWSTVKRSIDGFSIC